MFSWLPFWQWKGCLFVTKLKRQQGNCQKGYWCLCDSCQSAYIPVCFAVVLFCVDLFSVLLFFLCRFVLFCLCSSLSVASSARGKRSIFSSYFSSFFSFFWCCFVVVVVLFVGFFFIFCWFVLFCFCYSLSVASSARGKGSIDEACQPLRNHIVWSILAEIQKGVNRYVW